MTPKKLTYRFIPVRIRDLDTESGDLLVLSLFEDERPPGGLTGLVDWRMDGLISRIRANTVRPNLDNPHYRGLVLGPFHAGAGEKLLFPPGRYLSFFQVLVVGLGTRKAFDAPRYREVVRTVLASAASLGTTRLALQLPGWQAAGLPARRACDVFLTELLQVRKEKPSVLKEISFVEELEHQAEMEERIVEVIGH